MQPANKKTVSGNFDNVSFNALGVTSRFYRKGRRYFVETEGPDGQMGEFEIKYTFGVEPLQQYLVQFPQGRLQCLTIAWDTGKQQWFSLYPDERIAHDDPLHWTGLYQNWNQMCAECHSTNLRKNYDFESESYQTAWDEINVSCQACHGPGAAHVAWAQGAKEPGGGHQLAVDFKQKPRLQVEGCMRCHSRRHAVSANDLHGQAVGDHFLAETLREGLYHPDGQILDEVYVYGSFVQSKMYRNGVNCQHCHDPHSLKLVKQGNALCNQCHAVQPIESFRFIETKKDYDTQAHHFHPPDSEGAQCVNCHMASKNYMVVDPRRDHSFRIPRPDLSVLLGTPNVCNDCHQDQSAQWALDQMDQWYGSQRAKHFGETLAAGRRVEPKAGKDLIELIQDHTQSSIVRATALELLRAYGDQGFDAMAAALKDRDPQIRTYAVAGLEFSEAKSRLALLTPLLDDPVRAVRNEAARVLASVPESLWETQQRKKWDKALREYEEVQKSSADRPESHMNRALLATYRGQVDRVEAHYKNAIKTDGTYLPAHMNLANLYNQLGRNQEAEPLLRKMIEFYQGLGGDDYQTELGELNYSMGLLLSEMNRLQEAVDYLHQASQIMNERARVQYNYGLALQHLQRYPDAERALIKAQLLEPDEPQFVHALVIVHLQQKQWKKALPYAKRLVELSEDPATKELLGYIQKQIEE